MRLMIPITQQPYGEKKVNSLKTKIMIRLGDNDEYHHQRLKLLFEQNT